MKKYLFKIILFSFLPVSLLTAQEDEMTVKSIFDEALLKGESYSNLRYLCKDIGNRLSGSKQSLKAVEWAQQTLLEMNLDTVWLQEVMVPKWERGNVEYAKVKVNSTWKSLHISTLGGSVGSNGTIEGSLVVFNSIQDLELASEDEVKGKIVLLNQAMDPTFIDTFKAYGTCAGQRYWGASKAGAKGALAVLIRSLTLAQDQHAHTGVMAYADTLANIPAMAISTMDADFLMSIAKAQVRLETNPVHHGLVKSYNVIGELYGSDKREEYITFGGHLDSWDIGEGAHDDGAGVVHAMECIRLFKQLNLKNRRTLRCVLFMNEENGNKGGLTYANEVLRKNEKHVFALESDRGGFTPRGFQVKGNEAQVNFVAQFNRLLQPYLLHVFEEGFGGVDINPLKTESNFLIGFIPDSQRYFDYHHSEMDVFENVNKRELELGAAAITAIIYLTDRYLN